MPLSSKKISGQSDPTDVYLELLARHKDSGIVEMTNEGEHSYAAGYAGPRGVRTWQERMKLVEELGFIKSRKSGNQQYKYVLLTHPTIAVRSCLTKAKSIVFGGTRTDKGRSSRRRFCTRNSWRRTSRQKLFR